MAGHSLNTSDVARKLSTEYKSSESKGLSMPSSSFYVYILRCSDASLYVGHTCDIEQRLKLHNEGKGAKWTASRRPVELLHSEPAADEISAIRREL
jgi:putative endonuclease